MGFGDDPTRIRLGWRTVTPKSKRPRCKATYADGRRCAAAVVWDRDINRPLLDVCYSHGGAVALRESKMQRGKPHKRRTTAAERP